MLKDCFISPSGLYRYPSGPSSPPMSRSESLPRVLSGVFPALETAAKGGPKLLPPRLPSISRYVRKLPDTLLALQDFPSVHLRMPASRSSQTKTEPDLMDWRSFSDSLRWTLGNRPKRQASNSMMASAGVRTCPLYVSMSKQVEMVGTLGTASLELSGSSQERFRFRGTISRRSGLVRRTGRCGFASR